MKRVEFIGIPGSGKSRIRDGMVKDLQRRLNPRKFLSNEEALFLVARKHVDPYFRWVLNILPTNLAMKLWEKIDRRTYMHLQAQNVFLSSYPRALVSFLDSSLSKMMAVSERATVISYFLASGALFELLRRHVPSDVSVFFAEGLVHKSMMFLPVKAPSREDIPFPADYLDAIPLPDALFFVQADPMSCLARMKRRPAGLPRRLTDEEDEKILEYLVAADRFLHAVGAHVSALGKTAYFIVDNRGSPDDAVRMACRRFEALSRN